MGAGMWSPPGTSSRSIPVASRGQRAGGSRGGAWCACARERATEHRTLELAGLCYCVRAIYALALARNRRPQPAHPLQLARRQLKHAHVHDGHWVVAAARDQHHRPAAAAAAGQPVRGQRHWLHLLATGGGGGRGHPEAGLAGAAARSARAACVGGWSRAGWVVALAGHAATGCMRGLLRAPPVASLLLERRTGMGARCHANPTSLWCPLNPLGINPSNRVHTDQFGE